MILLVRGCMLDAGLLDVGWGCLTPDSLDSSHRLSSVDHLRTAECDAHIQYTHAYQEAISQPSRLDPARSVCVSISQTFCPFDSITIVSFCTGHDYQANLALIPTALSQTYSVSIGGERGKERRRGTSLSSHTDNGTSSHKQAAY
jgi:hypothetical protein